jgi:hypothetical protein
MPERIDLLREHTHKNDGCDSAHRVFYTLTRTRL